MSDDTTKKRPMSARGFLSKLNSAKSAIGFLAAHREYLTTGELSAVTSPIIRMVDEKQIMPTPALQEIQSLVFQHVQSEDLRKAEASLIRSNSPQKEPGNFVAQILDSEGRLQFRTTESGEEKALEKSFDMPQDAERWCDRYLFDGAPDWHAEITWTKCPEKLVDFKVRQIQREQAIERTLRKGSSPVTKKVTVGKAGGLGFGVKVRNDVAKFSQG